MKLPSEDVASTSEIIREVARERGRPIRKADVIPHVDLTEGSLDNKLSEMARQGELVRVDRGLYDLPENVDRPLEREESKTSTEDDDALTLRLESAGAGDPRDDDNGVIVASRRQLRAVLGYAPSPDNAFAIVVEGDSMEPWLREGQVAICLRTTEVTVSGRYVYWTGHGGRQVKHIEIAGDEALRITQHGPNPRSELYQHIEGKEYRDESGQTHTIKVIGRIVYPEDTARAVLEEVTSKLRSIVGA